ncbi:MAG: cytidylate kinase-like family protein [Erysipelotrichia bacterium]|nr:cytidylate kinase-like family protein [Erysipelotrichia bacterium]NCC55393.1 cytidylate kinase-like family protein [Erysipelotrichia bacterium]
MKTKTVITISRQFGSGGREIGKQLAKMLDIPFYDKELIAMAASESGIDEEVFKSEENRTSRAFYLMGTIGYTLGTPVTINPAMSLNDRMFMAQSDVIKNVAMNGPCVIVGRCSDYVLSDLDEVEVLNVFVKADMEDRKKRAVDEYKIAAQDVEDFIIKIDKERSNYYNYYTDRKWGNLKNYHLMLDTSKISIDQAVEIIAKIVAK